MIKEINTQRLIMRRLTKDDYKDAYEYLSDKEVMAHIEAPFSYKQTQEFVDMFSCENPRVYALALKEINKVIGHIIFAPYKHERVYEIGWIINKNFQGEGYGFEISNALIKYGFEELQLHRIFATTISPNIGSWRLLEKLGMKKEAVFRKSNFHHDQWIDEYWYGMLEEDYSNITKEA